MKVGIYPGSFDPITNGHLDIIDRAINLFDKLIISIAVDSKKDEALFSVSERKDMVSESISLYNNIEVDSNLIVIHQLPEKVLRVMINERDWSPNLLVQLGHIIGNRHRPLSIASDGSILFPIHDETEIELFKQLFSDIIDHLSLHVEDEIFVPNEGMNVHEH